MSSTWALYLTSVFQVIKFFVISTLISLRKWYVNQLHPLLIMCVDCIVNNFLAVLPERKWVVSIANQQNALLPLALQEVLSSRRVPKRLSRNGKESRCDRFCTPYFSQRRVDLPAKSHQSLVHLSKLTHPRRYVVINIEINFSVCYIMVLCGSFCRTPALDLRRVCMRSLVGIPQTAPVKKKYQLEMIPTSMKMMMLI